MICWEDDWLCQTIWDLMGISRDIIVWDYMDGTFW